MIKTLKKPRWNWLFWHRWLGIFACVGVLMWGLSGLSHPIMSRLQPKPAAFMAPQATFDLADALTPKTILAQHQINAFSHLSLSRVADHTYLRVATAQNMPARYFDIKTGEELEHGDEINAKALAAHFTGIGADQIANAQLVSQFDTDYHPVNRLLPVWRVSFKQDGNLRAFIDTEQTRLATLVDDTRYWLTQFFQFGHNWSFLSKVPALQLVIAASILSIILLSALSGLYLYVKQSATAKARLAKLSTRRWHRRLGLVVALTTLVFASSGLFHLVMSYQQEKSVRHLQPALVSAELLNDDVWKEITKQPMAKLDALGQGQEPYWFVLPASEQGENQMPVAQVAAMATEAEHAEHHDHHAHGDHDAEKKKPYMLCADKLGAEVAEDSVEQFAMRQALKFYSNHEPVVKAITWTTKFAGEYGFIFKRLPVLKVQLQDADNTRLYIEPATGALSATVRDIDGLEGFTFAYLHKWSFEGLNKDLRDLLVSLFALWNVVVAVLGLVLFTKKYKRG
jgi:uncharacterized iron-regulated membrane protein